MRVFVTIVMLLCAFAANAQRADGVGLRSSFKGAVARVAPAVVNIYTEKHVATRVVHPMLADPTFQQFFSFQAPMRERLQQSLGSGVIISADGIMVTNLHVVNGAEAAKIVLNDGREFAATLLNTDPKLDLAVLKLKLEGNEKVPFASFGDSDSLDVGDVVLAIGNPFGLGQSVSMGVVSAVNRTNANLSQYGQFIQTDASVNPGNSGGALIDSTGAVVGINSAIFSKSGGSQGISFAIPANLVRAVANDIVTKGRVVRPWFGAVGQTVTSALAQQLGLERATGVLVNEVMQGSPAELGGVKVGDVILEIMGVSITDPANLNEQILAMPNLLDAPASVTVWREGGAQNLAVQFEALPERRKADKTVITGPNPMSGYVVENLGPALNIELGLPVTTVGVAVVGQSGTSSYGSAGFQLQVGDLIQEVNKVEVKTTAALQTLMSESRRAWQLKFQRGNRVYNVVTQ